MFRTVARRLSIDSAFPLSRLAQKGAKLNPIPCCLFPYGVSGHCLGTNMELLSRNDKTYR